MRQTNTLPPPSVSLGRRVFAGGCEPLLDIGPSRRYLCESFPTCLDPTPAAPVVHTPVSSHRTSAFPTLGPGRRLAISIQQLSYGLVFDCSHSLMFMPADLLATPIAPTEALWSARQPWLLLPRLSRLVTLPEQWICLTVRFGQLTVRGLSPLEIRSHVGCSPNDQAHDASMRSAPS